MKKRRIVLALLALAFAALGLLADASPRAQPVEATFPGENGKIAFTLIQNNGALWNIFSIRADGQRLAQLTSASGSDNVMAYSPDGSKVAFYSGRARPDGIWDIYTMDAEGGDETRITNNTELEGPLAWSPDGEWIAFASTQDDSSDINIMDADGANLANVTNSAGADSDPVWAPDGGRLLFTSERDGNEEIYVMNADGTNVMNLTKNREADRSPAWSPDGSQIAFIRYTFANSRSEIYLMNSDGTNVHLLAEGLPEPHALAWSPTGERLLFTARSPEDSSIEDVYTIAPDGTDVRNVSHNTELGTTSPTWSPDGSKIVFRRHVTINGGAYNALYIVGADSDDLHQVYQVAANSLFLATWQPFFHRAGDVNCAGVTNSADATLLLQFSASLLHSLECDADADVNGDGHIDSVDAALILQYTAGLLDSLPP